MNAVLETIVELNIAAGAAILFVLLVRRAATRFLGPHAAYGLWAIVPVVMAATFLPERTTETLVTEFLIGGVPASLAAARLEASISWLTPLIAATWIIGIIALAALLVRRQRAFLRDADIGLAGPAIVGFRHPRIVTPDDFTRRFDHDERKLILTHEQVHIDRNDARINAFVAALRCLFWFNPLVHIGAKAMRTDQELSCDAEVIDRRPRVRRAYAETLLKTHLVSRPLPVGCYWPAESQHPLTERIDLIARKPISTRRRAAATALVFALTAGAGFTAWAAQPERTIFRETADVLLPFEPIARGETSSASVTQPRVVPSSFVAPALPVEWRAKSDVVAEICLTPEGEVASVEVVKSSGNARVDAASLRSLERTRFEPATRAGKAIAVCRQQITLEFDFNGAALTPP
jgi:TonB family protein